MSKLNVNWSELPEWVEWVAQDEDGEIYGYGSEPKESNGIWAIIQRDARYFFIETKELNCSHRETLTQRPKESNTAQLEKRIAELEAKVEALIPKPETETVKVYFYYDACQNIVYPTNSPTSIWERFAIKEVTVTKGEGL